MCILKATLEPAHEIMLRMRSYPVYGARILIAGPRLYLHVYL